MSEHLEITAETRTELGKAASRRLRRLDSKVPAVVYGAGKEPQHITINANSINKSLEFENFYSQVLSLSVDGKEQKVILKGLHRHPYKPKVMHLDFLRIKADEKLNVTIPIHFVGEEESPGLKAGGVVTHHINDLEISCLPANIPESIEVDISKMEMDDVIHLSEIKPPKNVELLALIQVTDDAHDQPVVSIHMPKIQEEPEEVELEEAEAAEGEEGAEAEAPAEGEEAKPEESSGEEKSE